MENYSRSAIYTSLPTYADISKVEITDGFFGEFINKIRTVSVPDILKKFLADGAIENYNRVARGEKGGHAGPPWYHGLICECIRGISDIFVSDPNPEIDSLLDDIIEAIAKAQDADPEGYINPYTTLERPGQRWGFNGGNIRWQHEVYNAGALIEAGVHHYRATGKTSLLKVAVRMANYLASVIGEAPKWNVTTEHSLTEMALVELERLFDDFPCVAEEVGAHRGEYLRLAMDLLGNKGNHKDRHMFPPFLREYAQDHCPVRDQREAVGHAVRAVLLYAGMAEAAAESRDEGLAYAAYCIWRDIAESKLHINGCVGVAPGDESFGQQYDLPNNAYLETCAGVGLALFGGAMFRLTGDASVWDVVENTLNNVVPASVSESGDHYTYQNPLETRGDFERWSWHGCPCCPPMLLKIVGEMPRYIWASKGSELMLNLYIESTAEIGTIRASYSKNSGNKSTVSIEGDTENLRLLLRIPEWARNFKVNGASPETIEKGYAVIDLRGEHTVSIEMDEPVVKVMAHPLVEADHGRIAFKCGPVLYCCEKKVENWDDLDFTLGDDTPVMNSDGSITVKSKSGEEFTLIEYRKWNNHGALPMRIWFKQDGHVSSPAETDGWEGKLYRPYAEYQL